MKKQKTTKKSRRAFLSNSVKLGAMAPLLASPALSSSLSKMAPASDNKKPLNILILGGTSYLGPHQIAYALGRGHKISTFTRGKTKPVIHPELFDQVEALVGDREDNLETLKGRQWDAVIDNSGRQVKWTEDTAELLKDHVGLYVYTSSVSALYPYVGSDFSESRQLVLKLPKGIEEDEKPVYEYGIMKANSENAAIKSFGKDRSIIIRPHFIVGPGDKKDRFNYWAVRMSLGGEVLIPGKDTDPVQFIDVRDLAGFMIRTIEDKSAGIYNCAGPASPMMVPAFVHGAHGAFSCPVNYVRIDDHEFLKEQELTFSCPWVLPHEKFTGMCKIENKLAIDKGMTFTPLAQTIKDIHTWWESKDAVSQERKDAIMVGEESRLAIERRIIEAWKNRDK